jgi:hypothetical protein
MRTTVLALAALLLAGCAGISSRPGHPSSPVAVEVTNQNRRDAAIYWVSSGIRYRLGTIVAGEHGRYVVRHNSRGTLGEVRLIAEVIGSADGYTTGRIAVAPGETIELQLEDLLVSSSYAVRQAPPRPVKPR